MGIASRILQETTQRGLAKKVLSDSGKKLLRSRLLGAPGRWLDKFAYNRTILNPLRAGEQFMGDVLGVETRAIPTRKVVTTPGRAATAAEPDVISHIDYGNGTLGRRIQYGKPGQSAVQEISKQVPTMEPYSAPRNAVGKLGAILGLSTYLGTGGAAYAGYNELKKDPNVPTAEGEAHPVVSEEEQKLRDTFAKKNLGGSDAFTPDMYKNMTKNSWVGKAINAIGKDRYKKLREKGDAALIHRTLVSAIHSDPELLKQAGSGDYALPGIYTDDNGPNVQVIHLNKGDKGYSPKILNHMFTVPEAE